jgi:predicted nucleic acid-binding protein
VPEEKDPVADALLADGSTLLAPELICSEFANALWSKVRRRLMTTEEALRLTEQFLADRPIELRPTEPLTSAAMAIGLRLDHPVYDCFYLALAQQERCPLVTADQRLQAAVKGTDLEPLVVAL